MSSKCSKILYKFLYDLLTKWYKILKYLKIVKKKDKLMKFV